MPHRVARLQQEVSGYLDLHDEQQILERITSQDWPGLAMIPTLDMGRGVMATRFFRSGSVVCDYHGPVLKRDQAESLRKSMSAAESNYMYFFKYDSQRLCIDAATVPCVCHPRIPSTFGRMVNHSGVHPNLRTVCRRIGDRVHLLLVATTDINPNEEFFFDYGVRSEDEGSRLSVLMT
jgi:SET domain-containing protein